MQLDHSWTVALNGEVFSNSGSFQIADRDPGVPTRFDVARRVSAGKRVLHVGCVDHLPLIEAKQANGTWMHGVLSSSASRCGGLDTNADGVDELRRLGYQDLFVGDIGAPSQELRAGGWEVLFLGEVLEHTDNPVSFLSRIVDSWTGSIERLVVTVPNAFAWSALRSTIRGIETVNTDHRYWFTPYTLAKVAVRAGCSVNEVYLCESSPPNPTLGLASRTKQRVLRGILDRRPIYRSSIVAELTI